MTSTPARASRYPSITPAGPAPAMQQLVVSGGVMRSDTCKLRTLSDPTANDSASGSKPRQVYSPRCPPLLTWRLGAWSSSCSGDSSQSWRSRAGSLRPSPTDRLPVDRTVPVLRATSVSPESALPRRRATVWLRASASAARTRPARRVNAAWTVNASATGRPARRVAAQATAASPAACPRPAA